MQRGSWADWGWWVFWAAISAAWCLTAAPHLSATFDEPLYVTEGLNGWRTGSHGGLLVWGTMPLPADVQTLPLYLLERWHGTPWHTDVEFERVLGIARAATLLFWWLLLAYAWRVALDLGGLWAARLLMPVLASEPNLLAHATLATTDIALAACLLAFLYHYAHGRDRPWLYRVGVPGVWFDMALFAKASALAFGPLGMLAVEMTRNREWPWWPRLERLVADALPIGLLGAMTLLVVCGSDWKPEPSFVAWADKLPEGTTRSAMQWTSRHLCIFTNGLEGVVRQIKHNARGHGMYLLGEAHPAAVWYYFPVLLSMKLPLPILIWIVLIVGGGGVRRLGTWPGIAAGLLFLFSLNCRVQIGIRLILPLIVLGTIAIVVAIAGGLRSASPRGRFWGTVGTSIGVVCMWLAAGFAWPDGLRYINILWGGSEHGHRLVADSNYDWGQGLPELAQWREAHGLDGLDVWYFGCDPSARRRGLRVLPLHQLPTPTAEALPRLVRGRYLAVSATLVHGYADSAFHRQALRWLNECPLAGETSTFLIYDVGSLQADNTPRP